MSQEKHSKKCSRRSLLLRLTSVASITALGVPVLDLASCQPGHVKHDGATELPREATTSQESTNSKPEIKPEPTLDAAQEKTGSTSDASGAAEPNETRLEPTPEIPNRQEPVPESKVCSPTVDNIEGPYYRSQAPWKTQISPPNEPGVPLTISGVVSDTECNPIAGAIVDVWQANQKGSYDNDGNNDPPNQAFHLRGRMRTNTQGQYEFKTIEPGRYLNGDTYRPSHIHYKIYKPGYETLTTQLYFKGDPYIKSDSFVRPSLIIPLQGNDKGRTGTFNIVIQKAKG